MSTMTDTVIANVLDAAETALDAARSGGRAVADHLPTDKLGNIDLTAIDLPRIDLSRIDLPAVDWSVLPASGLRLDDLIDDVIDEVGRTWRRRRTTVLVVAAATVATLGVLVVVRRRRARADVALADAAFTDAA